LVFGLWIFDHSSEVTHVRVDRADARADSATVHEVSHQAGGNAAGVASGAGCVPARLSLEAIREIAALLELHPAEVHDTMSFYGFFRDEQHPLGQHRVWVCRSISCSLRGGEELLAHLCEKYHVQPGETTEDGRVTLEFAECLGACEGAPCMLIDDDCEMNVSPERAEEIVGKL
jgi:NADH-quinone oxidoreductase subunit E